MNVNWLNLSEGLALSTLIRALNARMQMAPSAKTTTYTVTALDDTVLANATGGAFTVTLPTAVQIAGRIYTVFRTNSGANAVTVACNGAETINGSATQSLGAQYAFIRVESDGTNWIKIS